jgi:hypothetical protein
LVYSDNLMMPNVFGMSSLVVAIMVMVMVGRLRPVDAAFSESDISINKPNGKSAREMEIEKRMFGTVQMQQADSSSLRGQAKIPRFASVEAERHSQGAQAKDPWMDKAQAYPELKKSDAEMPKPDIAVGDQKYDDPRSPPKWLAHTKLEPPGLPETPPPPPPAMPPMMGRR